MKRGIIVPTEQLEHAILVLESIFVDKIWEIDPQNHYILEEGPYTMILFDDNVLKSYCVTTKELYAVIRNECIIDDSLLWN